MKTHSRLAIGVATLTALHAGVSHALGLGELQLQSALNQPLQAVIHLQDSGGLDPTDIRVSLADADAFARIGIDRPFFLTDLRFTPQRVSGELIIRVESSRPIREPYLNFLVQLDRGNGALLREYTLLLDPPLYVPAPVTAPALSEPGARPPGQTGPSASSTHASPRPAPARAVPVLRAQPDAARYQTRVGDSLWRIARDTRPGDSVAIQEQMDAILALNPTAFINGDPERLRAGQELILPTAAQMGVSSPSAQPFAAPVPRPADTGGRATELAGRLTIEEPKVQALTAEAEAMQQRLTTLETRFQSLLGELEFRDAQIASLQAELDIMRQARDAAQRVAEAPPVAATDDIPSTGDPADAVATPGAIEAAVVVESAAAEKTWLNRGWPLVLALLLLLAGGSWLRSRRQPEPETEPAPRPAAAPRPVVVPGNRTVDPLEGVELYLTYGRFAEARLMLEEAITAEPGRIDLRMRMLGVLADLGDAHRFSEHAREAVARGADPRQIEQLKLRFPLSQNTSQELVEPVDEPLPLLAEETGTLDLLDLEFDSSWDLFDDLPETASRRREELHQLQEDFESNLQDFPEVGELDEVETTRFRERGER